jgi:hypothetical protein
MATRYYVNFTGGDGGPRRLRNLVLTLHTVLWRARKELYMR